MEILNCINIFDYFQCFSHEFCTPIKTCYYFKKVQYINCTYKLYVAVKSIHIMGRRGRDRMVVWFTTIYAISTYHHWCCEFKRIWIRARCTTLCDQVYQWLATGRWFSPRPPVSATNKTDRHNITEILLKVAINTIK